MYTDLYLCDKYVKSPVIDNADVKQIIECDTYHTIILKDDSKIKIAKLHDRTFKRKVKWYIPSKTKPIRCTDLELITVWERENGKATVIKHFSHY